MSSDSQTVEYRDIEVEESSSVDDVVKIALNKFGIPEYEVSRYELRDVIGKYNTERWIEEYGKLLHSNEKPVSMEQFIRPSKGYMRRFELKKKDNQSKKRKESKNFIQSIAAFSESIDCQIVKMPKNEPFLLLLSGNDSETEKMVHPLVGTVLTVGSDPQGCDIPLQEEDIGGRHCWLTIHRNNDRTFLGVEPLADCKVKLNGNRIREPTNVFSGDIIQFGECFTFFFKDPNDSINKANVKTLNFEEDTVDYTTEELVARWLKMKKECYDQDRKRHKFAFDFDKSKEIIQYAADLIDRDGTYYRLAPVYFFAMTIEYCSVHQPQTHTRQFMIDLTETIQSSIQNLSSVVDDLDPKYHDVDSQDEFNQNFSKLSSWLANCSELYYFLKKNITQYLMDPSTSLKEEDFRLVDVEQRVESSLQNSIHKAFQTTINYLTRLLNKCINQMINCCFEDIEDEDNIHLIDLLQSIVDILEKSLIHSDIIRNLLDCILFFINCTVLNEILQNDKYFNFQFGIRIKTLLDPFGEWIIDNCLKTKADEKLKGLHQLVSLLSTPQIILLENNWMELKRKYPSIPSQRLYYILKNYKLKGNRSLPKLWEPDECITDSEDIILENFTNFPKLIIPRNGYQVNLKNKSIDKSFYETLAKISSAFYTAKSMQAKVDNVLGKETVSRQETLSSSYTVSRTKSTNTIDLLAELEGIDIPYDLNELPEGRCRANSQGNEIEGANNKEEALAFSRRRACSENLPRKALGSFQQRSHSISSPDVSIGGVESLKPIRPPRRKKTEKITKKELIPNELAKLNNLKQQLINDFIPTKRKTSKKNKRMTLNSIKTTTKDITKCPANNLQVPLANFITSRSTSRSSSIYSVRSDDSVFTADEEVKNINSRCLLEENKLVDDNLESNQYLLSVTPKTGEMFPLSDSSFCPVNFQSTNF
ncbi:DgyrCDS417 [Dimorphilus gyrociliatus]|uniref:DgyrCDS417 n=1 Tax=Dimorphilus gyrociliatus TaxID=2664684 RepID=A0A7I8V8Y6_9ANNE|nr:DgyrCDS417 [Dimorphilus gyrociliatus]